ncbi:MAG: RNA-binding protein [Alphaproteobacteria bacterium]|nr:RNA-binding protein [Alphaproteobacteria bacterium]
MYEMPVAENRGENARARRENASTRRCIVSADTLPRHRLIRFAVGPDDIVVPDLSERLPGRGLWVTARHDIVAQACERGAFRRAARRAVTPLIGANGEDLATLVDVQLAQRCLDALGLARRAGRLVAGFDQVRAALKAMAGPASAVRSSAILLTAQDAAADGRNKLQALADRVSENGAALTQLALFDAKTMGGAVGREQLVHALVETDVAGTQLYDVLQRLANYRGTPVPLDSESTTVVPSNVVEMD